MNIVTHIGCFILGGFIGIAAMALLTVGGNK